MFKKILMCFAVAMLSFGTNAEAQVSDSNANAVSINSEFGNVYGVKNGQVTIPVIVENNGGSDISSLGLIVEVNGKKEEITVNVPEKIEGTDSKYAFDLTFATPSMIGASDVKVTVDKVNGISNISNANEMNGKVIRLSRQVEHKPFIEEFTSMYCSNCPWGIVGMEKAHQQYGDKIIIIAVHYQDAMKCGLYMNQISKVVNFPRAHIDRNIKAVDPYYGTGRGASHGFGLGYDIDEMMNIPAVAEVKVDASLDDKILTAKADVTFLYTGDADYSLGFVMTEDGKSHEKWMQKNSLYMYQGQGLEDMEPLFDKWVNGSDKITDIVFDHVAITGLGIDEGIEGSIPTTVTEEEPITYEVTFDMEKYGKKIQSMDNVKICTMLFDNKTGNIVNSNFVNLSDVLGIEGVEAEGENVTEVARYTMDGRKISIPEKGINIVKMSDGKTKKVVVR